MNLYLIILMPFIGAVLPSVCTRYGRNAAAWAAAGITGLSLAVAAISVPAVFTGEMIAVSLPWLPALGLTLSLRLDGLSLLFVLLILGIGLLVIMYARYYLPARDTMGRFYAFLLLFMGSMLGIVLSENLILLLIFWELTSLSSFLLVGYWRHQAAAREGARMALTVTGGGGLALLAGILLLGHIAGSYELSAIVASGDQIRTHPFYPAALVLILLGAFTKSAQIPFHFWLPHAMAAPTPVSAYLHSATMVKAGIYLIARLHPALSGTDLWFFLVGGTGLLTLLFGAYTALFQHDLKGLLAYSTISHLGLITLLFGLGTDLGAVAGVFHIINHAIFKASLFMAAGIIDHECGTRDMRRINGLWNQMPHTGTLAMVAAASMAGVPLFNGFLSKEMFFAETLNQELLGSIYWILPTGAVLAGIFAVAYSIRFIHDVFFNGEPVGLPRTPHEPPRYMKIPVEVLVALCLLVGILPVITVVPLLDLATASVLQRAVPGYDLAIWHGFTGPFLMSLAALTGGGLIYALRRRIYALHDRLPVVSAKRIYEALLAAVTGGATRGTRALENGSLQRYLALFLVCAVILGVAPYLAGDALAFGASAAAPIDGISLVAGLIIAAAAIGTAAWHRQRLLALIMLSVVGLIVALTFARFSAPDLALTQLSVEVVSIILLLLALYFIPHHAHSGSGAARRLRDIALAGVAGGGIGFLCWSLLTRTHDGISGFYLEQAVPSGGGSNVVNVILVDFRGFDTLGEITVLAIAAVGIFTLLHGLRPHLPDRDADGRAWSRDRYPLIMAMLSRPLLPLALLVSLYLFLRGHNLPGGGFIAGLVTGVALILQYLANGIAWTRERLVLDYYPLIAAGILTSTVTGLASWLFGRPFLTSAFVHLHPPLIGEVALASALSFDIGVYLAVVGTVMLILARLGEITAPQHMAGLQNSEARD
ncbi:MAG: monovalent cation/H+ antiporter subunit A [Gammaproteobacteria bacterium]|nr:monovalent cation/H+ antiporter subunit A [Gammaproteobacteria bacterium]